jgi:hypothetical protein
VHFLHVPGKGPDPCPLLLMHGWPGSVFEFIDIIPRLTDPARFGGDPADAFTVVAPSLPGYGMSFRPSQKRFGIEEIADCLADLKRALLAFIRPAEADANPIYITVRLRADDVWDPPGPRPNWVDSQYTKMDSRYVVVFQMGRSQNSPPFKRNPLAISWTTTFPAQTATLPARAASR